MKSVLIKFFGHEGGIIIYMQTLVFVFIVIIATIFALQPSSGACLFT